MSRLSRARPNYHGSALSVVPSLPALYGSCDDDTHASTVSDCLNRHINDMKYSMRCDRHMGNDATSRDCPDCSLPVDNKEDRHSKLGPDYSPTFHLHPATERDGAHEVIEPTIKWSTGLSYSDDRGLRQLAQKLAHIQSHYDEAGKESGIITVRWSDDESRAWAKKVFTQAFQAKYKGSRGGSVAFSESSDVGSA